MHGETVKLTVQNLVVFDLYIYHILVFVRFKLTEDSFLGSKATRA